MCESSTPLKTCSDCRLSFPATRAFFPSKGRNRLRSYCKSCATTHGHYDPVRQRTYYRAHHPTILARHAAYRLAQGPARALRRRLRYAELKALGQLPETAESPIARAHRQRVAQARAYAVAHGLPAWYTMAHWRAALGYWYHTCPLCGTEEQPGRLLSVDHWVPLIDPACPGTVPGNMVPLCLHCNLTKHCHPSAFYLQRRFGPAVALLLSEQVELFLSHMACRFPGPGIESVTG